MTALSINATIETGNLLSSRPGGHIRGKVVFTEVVRGVIGEAVVRSAPGAEVVILRSDCLSTDRYCVVRPLDERSVSLTVNGRSISPDKPVGGGLVEFLWTPLRKSVADVEVIFHEPGVDDARRDSASDGVQTDIRHLNLSLVVNQEINVLAQRRPNPISVTTVVDGVAGAPRQDRGVLRYAAGSRVLLVMSIGSGTAVDLGVLGPCLLSGNSLCIPATGGSCLVRFSAPGGPNNSSNEAQVLITVAVGSGTLAETEQNLQGVLKSGWGR